MGKLLAHYELYKKIMDIPGDIIECGVYKGASFMRWASFRNLLETNDARKLYGFDAFGRFPKTGLTSSRDVKFADEFDDGGGVGISEGLLSDLMVAKNFTNFELIKGNVVETVKTFLENNPNLKVSLLHLDMDVYDPTKFALEMFSKHMSRGGIIALDDYLSVEGATRATDEFVLKTNLKVKELSHVNVSYYLEMT